MTPQICIYNYNQTFYTGTSAQPDVLNIFVKPDKGNKNVFCYNAIPLANWMGYFPVISIFSGLTRVTNAVKIIFKNLSDLKKNPEKITPKSDLWNALKNIFRGIVEIIPFTGITLIIFDSIRIAVHLHRVNNELKDKENIAGVAIDGKVIFTIDLGKIDNIITNPPPNSKLNEYRLELFRHLCLTFLKMSDSKMNVKIGMDELLPKLAKFPFQKPNM